MPYHEIYKDNVKVVAEGADKDSVMAVARALYPYDHLVGLRYPTSDHPYGTFSVFFVPHAPIVLGT
jgi:hypothetical protein